MFARVPHPRKRGHAQQPRRQDVDKGRLNSRVVVKPLPWRFADLVDQRLRPIDSHRGDSTAGDAMTSLVSKESWCAIRGCYRSSSIFRFRSSETTAWVVRET